MRDAWDRTLVYFGVRDDGSEPARPTRAEVTVFCGLAIICAVLAQLTDSEVLAIATGGIAVNAVYRLVQRYRPRSG